MRAWLNLRHAVPARREAFARGLGRLGYTVIDGLTFRPGASDILVTWNRIRDGHTAACAFESRGLPVLVAENASWGNDFQGGHWYTLARGFHNKAGAFPVEGPERWDALTVELAPWRRSGETVVLPQRGIGPPGIAMPLSWTERVHREVGGRIRKHPGQSAARPLCEDLAQAGRVVTWGSGAAIRALMWGIPVRSDMPGWIGEQDNTGAGRLAMLRRLAWAQWQLHEIATGEPMRRLLS
ncbi:hypothetical protein LVB77_14595 [Lysobacter sp. 5GHs7-4]|uniref:hypothetical protein n=1 Tax=Lysobacter sp. 5GHs7-4 TaxID=2904253 RepID=UPI001E544E3C|nr:hypothetical protein [Lysobacter sp. 5GHs7-4]UHQ21895.1 hypothetical protein LVB77_14595 [Lysobacter sp. 5GHs7-4]